MLGGGIQQVPAVARLKNIGYRVIVTDTNPEAPAFADADVTVNIGAHDVKSLISWILLNKSQLNIAGIFTLTNYAVSVALVANATGLATLPPEIAVTCDNKLLMKRKFKEFGFFTPEYYEVSSLEETIEAFQTLGGTCYLKVVDGFGGKGVSKITEEQDIHRVYDALKNESLYPEMILEKEIIGHFIDTQGVFHEGTFYPAGDADSFFSNSLAQYKHFNPVETFNICPSQQAPENIEKAYNMLRDIAIALKMDFGPVGGDFVLDEQGLHVIEVGPRLHGPNGTLQIFPKAMQIKPLEFMAQVLCGDTPNTEFVHISRESVALCHVFVSNKPQIEDVGFSAPPLEQPGVFTSYIYKKAGETLKQSAMKLSGLASVFVSGDNLEQAQSRLATVKSLFYVTKSKRGEG